jgi:hypothetical protein
MKNLFFCAVLGCTILFAPGCKKDEPTTPTTPVTPAAPVIRVSFANMVDAVPLTLGPPYQYVNLNGDSFYVNTFKYYISNISFTDVNSNTWAETESYHLINAADPASLSFTIANVPAADYVSMRFMIGVDSARNCSGAQTGALDPANDMFWTWNTGYIMAKLEGKSPASTASADNISFHIAGYGGANATQRWVTLPFTANNAHVASGASPLVRLSTNVQEWFSSPTTINFATTNSVATTGSQAIMFADNYADMITLLGVDN